MNVSVEKMTASSVLEYKWIIILCFLLVVPLTLLAEAIGKEEYVIAVLTLVPIALLAVLSYQSMMYLLIASLFIHAHYLYVTPGAYCSILFLMSFAITRRELSLAEFRTPLTIPFFVYCLTIIPSFLNASQPIKNIAMLHNLFAFAVVMHISAMPIARGENIRKNIYFYLFLVLLNSVDVIAEAFITSKRVFGFAGVMFVDYVGTGLVIVTLLALTNKGAKSFFYYFLAGVFSVALVLTQTRGVWLVTMTTIVLMIVYLFFRGKELGVSRRSVTAFCLVGAVFVLFVFGVATYLNPEISKRTEQFVESKQFAVNEEGATTSSLVTRVLVWNTAYNAFVAHPIVGIGAYGFPFSSKHYNSLPKVLFDRYVKGLTPHIGYLAVLAETGIIGLTGFIVFIIFGLKTVFKPLLLPTRTRARWSLIFAWTFVYIAISMFTTDAWLWGQGIVLMGIVLGLGIANQKIVEEGK